MSQFQLPKPVADRLLKHVTSISDGLDPDDVMADCIKAGIEAMKATGGPSTKVRRLDSAYKTKGASEQRTIKYTQIKDHKKIFDSLKIEHELESRRHLIREAAISYCEQNNIDCTI